MLRFSLASLLALTAVVGLSVAAILNPNVWFAMGFHLTLLAAVFTALYMALFCRGTRQRLAGGFAVFVIGMHVWPAWFGDSIYVADRLASIITDQQSLSVAGWSSYPPLVYSSPGSILSNSNDPFAPPATANPYTNAVTVVAAPVGDLTSLRNIISSLLALAAGVAGIVVALVVSRLEARAAPQERNLPTQQRGQVP